MNTHPFIDFVSKNFQRFLGEGTLDLCKVLHLLLSSGKTRFNIVLVGNKNLIPDEKGFVSIAKVFDVMINLKGFDGSLIVIDPDNDHTQNLSDITSEKTSIVNDDYMTVLSGLAATLKEPIDLLFFSDGGNALISNTYSKTAKPLTIIDDILDEKAILVLDESQMGSKLASDIDTWADESDKKAFVNNKLIGWVW